MTDQLDFETIVNYKKLPVDKIISSQQALENFIQSSIHTDFMNELSIREHMINTALDDTELQYTGRQYDMFRGGKRMLNELRTIFEDLLENKKDDNYHEERSKK